VAALLSILAHAKVMRPKFVLAILLAAGLIIGTIIFLKPHSSVPVPDVAPAPAVSAAPAPTPAPAPAPAPVVVKKTLTPEEHQAAIDAETDRLSAWAMNDDPQSLSNILSDLTSPEKEIRMAAIEAAKQFESTNAIPALKAAAANAEDNEEAIAMLEAADWLALPSADFNSPVTKSQLTPEQAQRIEQDRAKAQARRQEYLQQRAGNQNPQSTPGQNPTTGSNP
jgi:CheY-like chemotaxis protein